MLGTDTGNGDRLEWGSEKALQEGGKLGQLWDLHESIGVETEAGQVPASVLLRTLA